MKTANSSNFDPFDFCLVVGNRQYTLASLNIVKREVFIKVHFERENRGIEQKFTNEKNVTSSHGITDHISFHKDGTVHLTCKKYKKKTHRQIAAQVEGGVFDLPDQEVIPFLFLSFMLNDNEYRLPLKQFSKKNHVWKLLEKTNVGLIFYVLSKKFVSSFIRDFGYKFVITPDNAAYILNGINNKVILVILTNKVLFPPSNGVNQVEKHWKSMNAHNILNISVYPQWERLQSLLKT
jgi:hypothetical protein